MTPLEISILIHYYARADELSASGIVESAPAVIDSVERLLNDNLLTNETGDSNKSRDITDRGRAFVDAVCHLPLPEQYWHVPGVSFE